MNNLAINPINISERNYIDYLHWFQLISNIDNIDNIGQHSVRKNCLLLSPVVLEQ